MKRYEKLKAVIRHEYLTIVKQRSFWLSLLVIPLFIAFAIGVSYLSELGTDEFDDNEQGYDITVVDQSGIITREIASSAGAELAETTDPQPLIEDVRNNELDGLIVYPDNISEEQIYQVYVNDSGQTEGNRAQTVSGLGGYLLQRSLLAPIGSQDLIDLALSADSWETEVTTYEDGQESSGFAAFVIPGLFAAMFYIVFFISINYAMTSVAEEKENRAIEMVLTYINPRTLITGKLLGVTLVAMTQLLFYALFAAAAYIAARTLGGGLELPIALDGLVFEAQPVIFGALYLVSGYILFAALMLATGAAFPSAKEANSFAGVFYMLVFLPYVAFGTISNMPEAFLTQFSTYFPLTAPPTLLLRNTVGNISLLESIIGLAVLIVSTIVAVWLAGKIFRAGNLNFSSRVKLSQIFK